MIRAVVFDLDYTLAVPTRDRETILREAVDATGAPEITREEYLEVHGQHLTRESREPIFADLLEGRVDEDGGGDGNEDGDEDKDETEVGVVPERLAAAYRETIADALEPLPGVEAMIADLRGEYRVGLLTNGPVRAQRDKLETLGWEDAFDAALVTGELEAGKPDPRAFEAIAAELDVAPGETVYVGDDVEADVYGATNAGMAVVQVLLEDGPDPDPRAAAHVDQKAVATAIPEVVANLDTNRN